MGRSRKPSLQCLIPQLSFEARAESGQTGWLYRNDDADADCAGASLHFSEGTIASGDYIYMQCSQTQRADTQGELVDVASAECGPAVNTDSDDIGAACTPLVLENGFDDRAKYVETRSTECGGGACLVYRLSGDPSPDCAPSADPPRVCASEEDVQERVYCSCRCDAPEGDPGPLCDCDDGFTCVNVLESGPPGVRGSYCVRNGSLTD